MFLSPPCSRESKREEGKIRHVFGGSCMWNQNPAVQMDSRKSCPLNSYDLHCKVLLVTSIQKILSRFTFEFCILQFIYQARSPGFFLYL